MSESLHARASSLLASVRDVIDEREDGDTPPAWVVGRGWAPFLDALPDATLSAIERDGLAAAVDTLPDVPADLVALAHAVAEVTHLARSDAAPADTVTSRRASPRKRAQVAAVASLAARVGGVGSRAIDLGSGHGHLTRHLAHALGITVEGWDHDPARVTTATALTDERGPRFVARDVRVAPIACDLVVGLHACGALGEHAVRAAVDARAALVFVACCPQKREGNREPLIVPRALTTGALTLARDVLGLANRADGDAGVEADRVTRTQSRIQRRAVRALLRDAGRAVAPGEEMHAVNRRRATGGFDALVTAVFSARGLEQPGRVACATALEAAVRAHARLARWALPRTMMARLIEVWIAYDRAAWLASRGHAVSVVEAFGREVSPRNVALVAWPS